MHSPLRLISYLPPARWQEYKHLRLQALLDAPQAFDSSYQDKSEEPDAIWQERLVNCLESKNHWMVFAERDSKLIGMVGAFQANDERESGSVQIIAMFVTKEERGKGIAKVLLNHLLEILKQSFRVKRVILEVNTAQRAAVNLYKSLGFQVTDQKWRNWRNGEKIKSDLMEKEL